MFSLLLGTSKAGSAILDRIMVLVSTVYDNDSKENPAPMNEEGSDLFGLSCVILPRAGEYFPAAWSLIISYTILDPGV